ncbi:shikimate dehydrogenase [Pseudochelatococcus sp. B33]
MTAEPAFLVGLIGTGIQGSLAPEIHMSEGQALGLRYVYRLIDLAALRLDAAALPEIVENAQRLGFDGLAVTHPFKQAVVSLMGSLSDDAQALGAVNTVTFRNGRRIGHNTDWQGFSEALRRQMGGVATGRIVQLGAGGAGVAAAFATLKAGAERLELFDPDEARLDNALRLLRDLFGAGRVVKGRDIDRAVESANGLVNATPIGMDAHPGSPLPLTLLRQDLWVFDLIYFPRETALVRQARAIGATARNGGGMVVYQAIEQIRLFTGHDPDPARVLANFETISSP